MFKIKNLKKSLAFYCLSLISVNCTFAQTQNPVWSLPPFYDKMNPLGGLPKTMPELTVSYYVVHDFTNLTNYVVTPTNSHNMIADAAGNNLVDILDGNFFDSTGNPIAALPKDYVLNWAIQGITSADPSPGFSGAFNCVPGYAETCLVPNPQNCKQYYIFTSGAPSSFNDSHGTAGIYHFSGLLSSTNPTYYPFYGMIDMSLTNVNGSKGVLQKYIQVNPGMSGSSAQDTFNLAPLFPILYPVSVPIKASVYYYAATDVIGTGTSAYNLVFASDGAKCYCLKLDGVTPVSLISADSSVTTAVYSQQFRSEMEVVKLSSGNYRVAWPYMDVNGWVYMHVADYTSSGTLLTGASGGGDIKIGAFIHGVEFNPTGDTLYLSHDTNLGSYTSTLDYVPVASIMGGGFLQIPLNTSYNVSGLTTDVSQSQIELNYQGSTPYLYFANTTNLISYNLTTHTWNNSAVTFPAPPIGYPGYQIGEFATPSSYYLNSYLLPDQIDGGYYVGSSGAPTACCLFYTDYDRVMYNAGVSQPSGFTATTQTWSPNTSTGYNNNPLTTSTSSVVTIGEELRIPAGYKITINNMTIKFSPQARLIIENGTTASVAGGHLVLNNCTLTVDSRCKANEMWLGVQVWGSPGSTHGTLFQGYLALNNCEIENAYVGVLAGFDTTNWYSPITPKPTAPFVPSTLRSFGSASHLGGGGFVVATSSTFLNNMKSIVFNDYAPSPNAGGNLATLCNFSVNSALLTSGVTPWSFITLYNDVNNFVVKGSTFYNSHTLYQDTGIFSINSSYSVDQNSSTTRSIFTSLQYGIYSYNNSGSATISCEHSTFNDNIYGIYLGLINTAAVELDTFRIHQYTCRGLCTSLPSYGLYLDNCTGYDVQDNYLTRYGSSVSNNCFGIIANNSGTHANAIFRNTFNNIYTGSQAQFINYMSQLGTPHNYSGLLYQCNIFTGSLPRADIYVPGNTSGSNYGTTSCPTCSLSGVQYAQGSGGSSGYPATADNQFSHTGSGAYDFYIDSTSTATAYNSDYEYYCTSGTCPTSSYNPLIRKNLTKATVATTTVVCSSTNPYSNGYRTSGSADPTAPLLSQADDYKQVYDSLTNLTDGGSTSGLLLLVNGNNNHQAVLNSLTQAVPYISDDVLKAYMNSGYPTSDIVQILTACSPLSNEVNSALMASNLSSGIKSQLATLQNGTSKMFSLNGLRGSVLTSRHLLMDKAIHTLLESNDSTNTQLQQAYVIMRTRANELSHRVRLETALELGDTATAQQELTAVSNLEGNTNYVALYTILVNNIGKAPEKFVQDQSVQSKLLAMITDSSDRHTYLRANILLRSIGINRYTPYIQQGSNTINNDDNARTLAPQAATTTIIQSESTLYNNPNPFKETTTIQAHIVEKTQNAFLVITDMLGAEIARYPVQQGDNNISVNAVNLSQSVMFCTLVVDGVKIKTNKMVLIK